MVQTYERTPLQYLLKPWFRKMNIMASAVGRPAVYF
jgi:hypothetical protein